MIAAANVTVNVLLAPVPESDAVLPAKVPVRAPDASVNATVIEVAEEVPTVSAVPLDPIKVIFRFLPVHAVVSSVLKTIVATLKTVEPLDQLSVIAEVIALSHATAACEPCPNSKLLPLLRDTLAAKVVATSGPIVAIKSPAIIFLVR